MVAETSKTDRITVYHRIHFRSVFASQKTEFKYNLCIQDSYVVELMFFLYLFCNIVIVHTTRSPVLKVLIEFLHFRAVCGVQTAGEDEQGGGT